MASLQDIAAQHALNNALSKLLNTDVVGPALARNNRQQYRASFSKFVVEARSAVRRR
jgi:hypothetical protein